MTPRTVDLLGPVFVAEEMDDLELLTDLLYLAGDYLGVVFAVASWVEGTLHGMDYVGPIAMERLGRALKQLARNGSKVRALDVEQRMSPRSTAASQASLLKIHCASPESASARLVQHGPQPLSWLSLGTSGAAIPRPKEFGKPYVTTRNVPYTLTLEPLHLPIASGGVLGVGALLWTREVFGPKPPPRIVLAFADGIGTVLLEPRCLVSAKGTAAYLDTPHA